MSSAHGIYGAGPGAGGTTLAKASDQGLNYLAERLDTANERLLNAANRIQEMVHLIHGRGAQEDKLIRTDSPQPIRPSARDKIEFLHDNISLIEKAISRAENGS
jgi:hypothetical protein